MDQDDSAWYPIPNHPNHEVSLRGHVRHKKTHHVLRPIVDKDGYYRMSLGNVDNVPVHRIVCSSIYGEPPKGKTQVNHRDSNRQNNHFLNLEWVSPKENVIHGIKYGNIDPSIGLAKAVEVNKKPVRIIETGMEFDSVKECAEYFHAKPTNISRVLSGSRKGQAFHKCHLEYIEKDD